MKRLLKLLISLLVRCWDVCRLTSLRLFGRPVPSSAVVIYYHAVPNSQRQAFARQMDMLLEHTIPVHAGSNSFPNSGRRFCAVTFDDGFASVIENAVPEMESRSIPSTHFIPSGCLGGPPPWVKDPAHPAAGQIILTEAQLLALSRNPLVTIGSHSVSHPRLATLDDTRARFELTESKVRLEKLRGRPVTLFAFPHGSCKPRTLELARKAGYHRVFTTAPEQTSNMDAFVLGRAAVEPSDWPIEFRLKILGAYRWMSRLRGGKTAVVPAQRADSRDPITPALSRQTKAHTLPSAH